MVLTALRHNPRKSAIPNRPGGATTVRWRAVNTVPSVDPESVGSTFRNPYRTQVLIRRDLLAWPNLLLPEGCHWASDGTVIAPNGPALEMLP